MYRDYNMAQLTLAIEISIFITTNDTSRHVNEIVETIFENVFDEFKHHRDATHIIPK
ncbi:IS5/IS1182 family transposase, partial [bacterium M00.F.Ca.ET.163.01.1.1]